MTPVPPQSEKLEKAKLHARADHDFNYVSNVRALYEAMALLAEAKYTPREMVRLSDRQPSHDLLGATANQALWFCSEVRREVLNKRESRKREEVTPSHGPNERPETVN